MLQKFRARGNKGERIIDLIQQGQVSSPRRDNENQRPSKLRRSGDEVESDVTTAAGTASITPATTRSTFTEELRNKVEAQKSNTSTMHVTMNSKRLNSKSSMRNVYNDQGAGYDQSTQMGGTSSCMYGRTKFENDAIGRILKNKS